MEKIKLYLEYKTTWMSAPISPQTKDLKHSPTETLNGHSLKPMPDSMEVSMFREEQDQ